MEIASSILEEMKDAGEADVVSLGKFIAQNIDSLDALSRSGKNVKQIYEYLKAKGQDVGTYHGFRSICYRAGLRQRTTKKTSAMREKSVKAQDIKGTKKVQGSPKLGNAISEDEHKGKGSKYNPALPPVFLPGGVEAIIDLETGAKCFEIKSERE
jgi:hypothetical protein